MKHVIFAIDNPSDLHTLARFLRFVDELRAMQKLKGTLKPCIGAYKGDLELSYIMTKEDFDAHVRGSQWVSGQESFLDVEQGYYGRTYAALDFTDGSRVYLGELEAETDKLGLMIGQNWTYRPDLKTFYFTEEN